MVDRDNKFYNLKRFTSLSTRLFVFSGVHPWICKCEYQHLAPLQPTTGCSTSKQQNTYFEFVGVWNATHRCSNGCYNSINTQYSD